MQPLAVGAVVPRDEAAEVPALVLEAALARLGAPVRVDVVADVERAALDGVRDVPGEVDVPQRGAELRGDVLRDVVHVRPGGARLAHLVVVDELRHDAALAEGALERAVAVLALVAVAVVEHAEHHEARAAGDLRLDVRRGDRRQAVRDEVRVALAAVDVDDVALLHPHAADALVDVEDLAREPAGLGAPREHDVLGALLVEADVHRLHREVRVRAEVVGRAGDADLHGAHLLRGDLLELGAADVEAVDAEQLARRLGAELPDEAHALVLELGGHLRAPRREVAARLGAELVDEDELGHELRAAVAVAPEHRLVHVLRDEPVALLVVLGEGDRAAALELERRVDRRLAVDLVDDVVALLRAVRRHHARPLERERPVLLHEVERRHARLDVRARVDDEHDAVAGDLEGREVARDDDHVAVDALPAVVAVHLAGAAEPEGLEDLGEHVAVDLHRLRLVRERVELELRHVLLAQVHGGAEGPDGYHAVERLLELVADVLRAVEHGAGDDDVEALEDVLAEDLPQVHRHELLALDLGHRVVLLDDARVLVHLRRLHADAHGVPRGRRHLRPLAQGVALARHELLARAGLRLAPVAVPAAGAQAPVGHVLVRADARLAAAAVAAPLRRAEEGDARVWAARARATEAASSAVAATLEVAARAAVVEAAALGVWAGGLVAAVLVVVAAVVVSSVVVSAVVAPEVATAVIPAVVASEIIAAVVPAVISAVVVSAVISSEIIPAVVAPVIVAAVVVVVSSMVIAAVVPAEIVTAVIPAVVAPVVVTIVVALVVAVVAVATVVAVVAHY